MHALHVLEFDKVRQMLAAQCDTPMGATSAAAILPRFRAEEVEFEVGRTAEAEALLSEESLSMRGVWDVATPVKLAEKEGVLDGATLHKVGESLAVMANASSVVTPRKADWPLLGRLADRLPVLGGLADKLLHSFDGDGYVRDEASAVLGDLRKKKAVTAQRILTRIQSYVSGKTRDLLSDAVYTQRDGRYVLPVKAENRGKIKGIVHDTSASGATVYVEPEDVVALGNELRQVEAAENAEIERILRDFSARVGKEGPDIRNGLDASGELDLVLAKSRLGSVMGGSVPLLVNGPFVEIREARHPLLPRETCVPLSLSMGSSDGARGQASDVLLITGPNTGGKTVAIKTVGLCVVMAQCGMMPPARTVKIGCFSQVWADIGDEQSLQQSLSTFSGHIKNIAEALGGLKRDALVLLDEIGAGTDPAEGSALARAVLIAFQEGGAKVIASTHYGELKLLAANREGFLNASMEFDQKSLRPTYSLLVGVPGSSHALKIAERYGVPKSVIEEATRGVTDEEVDVAKTIERLEVAQKQAKAAQSEADRLAHRLRDVEQEAQSKIEQADVAKQNIRERASEQLEALLREIRLEAHDVFEQLKKEPSQAGFDRARARLKELQDVGREFVEDTRPKPRAKSEAVAGAIKKGATVRIAGLTQTGIVIEEPKGAQVLVQAGALKMTCKLADLSLVDAQPAPAAKAKSGSVRVNKAMTARTEIHLRQMRAEDAQVELDRFLDDAVLGGVPSVRIVHGKGEGILRKVTQDTLRRHKDVKSFRSGEPEEGGEGVTVAILK